MADEWFYAKHGIQFGPVTWQQLAELADQGALGPVDLVWNQRLVQWVAAGSVKGLFVNVFTPPLPPPLPLPPSPPIPPPLPPVSAVPPTEAVKLSVSAPQPALPVSLDAHRGRRFGECAKWVLFAWSAVCISGVVYGLVSVAALPLSTLDDSAQAARVLRGGLDIHTWCAIWAVIGVPSLTVWLLTKNG